ncbi:MAG TPA: GNAT family N-acetyltransferase [Solirubrobacteraceae bacterium]|nr:GNAT family N-acetyltransferase [Solirubrobacteraceae bacterium]
MSRGVGTAVPRSLVWATDIDVLPIDRVVERRDDHLVVRSPSNPTHYWGNLIVFDEPPRHGDRQRWERLFAAAFASQPASRHLTFCWDRTDGVAGEAASDFEAAGYDLERTVGLVANPADIHEHPRANREVTVRALRPHPGSDEKLWDGVVELQVAGRDPERFAEEPHRIFCRRRLDDLRVLFCAGRGAWYVALAADEVVGSCGVVVTGGRGRFQLVDTAPAHRRRGICRRLVAEAAQDAAAAHGARRLVIAADPGYHALGIYESLGFVAAERVIGVCRQPAEDRATPR